MIVESRNEVIGSEAEEPWSTGFYCSRSSGKYSLSDHPGPVVVLLHKSISGSLVCSIRLRRGS